MFDPEKMFEDIDKQMKQMFGQKKKKTKKKAKNSGLFDIKMPTIEQPKQQKKKKKSRKKQNVFEDFFGNSSQKTASFKMPKIEMPNIGLVKQKKKNKKKKSKLGIGLIDSDNDGVPNIRDCRPFDPLRQDEGEPNPEKIHENRSKIAQETDEALQAEKVTSDKMKWAKNPNRYDYKGVDTKQKEERGKQVLLDKMTNATRDKEISVRMDNGSEYEMEVSEVKNRVTNGSGFVSVHAFGDGGVYELYVVKEEGNWSDPKLKHRERGEEDKELGEVEKIEGLPTSSEAIP